MTTEDTLEVLRQRLDEQSKKIAELETKINTGTTAMLALTMQKSSAIRALKCSAQKNVELIDVMDQQDRLIRFLLGPEFLQNKAFQEVQERISGLGDM